MIVLGKNRLIEFISKHGRAKKSLEKWLQVAEACQAKSPMDLRKTFNSVDPVPPQTVFDIAGNKYRLIARVDYENGVILISHVLTHSEYDKNKWRV